MRQSDFSRVKSVLPFSCPNQKNSKIIRILTIACNYFDFTGLHQNYFLYSFDDSSSRIIGSKMWGKEAKQPIQLIAVMKL